MVDFTNTNGDCDFLVILVSNGGYCFSAVKNDQYDVIVQIPVFLAKLIIEIAKTRSGNQLCQDVFFVSIIANRDIMICNQIKKRIRLWCGFEGHRLT